MNRRIALSALTAVGLALFAAEAPAYAADPTSFGTWNLNIAKSKSTEPMPKSIVRTYESTGAMEKLTGTIVTADGTSIPIAFTANVDGTDTPFKSPGFDSVALTRVDGRTISFVNKLAGKQMSTGTRVLSTDGKTMTFEQKGTNASGAPFASTMVYDKR